MVNSHQSVAGRRSSCLLAALGMACGCVERRYTVRTDPPGAQVIVNGESLGPAPASHNFYYYGDREITLVLDGFETKTIIQPINAPWWDNYLTEFFSENIVPFVIRDEREFTYKMEPYPAPTEEEIQARAEALRSESRTLAAAASRGDPGMAGILSGIAARTRGREYPGVAQVGVGRVGNPRNSA